VTDKAVDKYLARWAEPEVHAIEGALGSGWDAVVVVPCRDEDPARIVRLRRELAVVAPGALLIVVSNGPAGAPRSPEADLLRAQVSREPRWQSPHVGWLRGEGCGALWVERCGETRGIPENQGVGRARKLGGDLALALWAKGAVRSSWIHYTDADATPSPEITKVEAAGNSAAVVWPFGHEPSEDEGLRRAHLQHEIWMRWWVRGLEYARSPFAYHTIGSCMSVSMAGYAQVRGVPPKAAGEDFHALRKLAKVGTVFRWTRGPVKIETRRSLRVPFGTGPAAARLSSDPSSWRLSTPEVFEHLRRWLDVMDEIVAGQRDPWIYAGDSRELIEAAVVDVMGAGWRDKLTRADRPLGSRRGAHESFDALKTLRFVHSLERTPQLRTRAGAELLEGTPSMTTEALERWCDALRSEEVSFSKEVGRARMVARSEPRRDMGVQRWMTTPGITDGEA
jgi:hypothetical protein